MERHDSSVAVLCLGRKGEVSLLPVLISLVVFAHVLAPAASAVIGIGPDGSNAQAVHALGNTGAGVNVAFIAASNTLTTHEAFYDKDAGGLPTGSSHAFAYNMSGDTSGIVVSDHDTWVAGIIASRGGVTHPDDIGVAPGADVYNARVIRTAGMTMGEFTTALENALDYLIGNRSCRVVCTGFQIDPAQLAPDGTSTLTKMYDYYAETYNVVFANAAGNYSGSNTNTTVFGDAYNGITAGGLAVLEPYVWRKVGSLSNFGPTGDGRRKPDIVAPSQNQTVPTDTGDTVWLTWTSAGGETSLSAPHIAGVAALLLEMADATSEQYDAQNEVIRAVIVNSTFPNIQDAAGTATTGLVYNNARGYGRIDALRAHQTLSAARMQPGDSTAALRGWAYEEFPKRTTGTHTYYVFGNRHERLVTTLAWNRKFSAEYTPRGLVDLNLQVLDPDGLTVFAETGTIDNLDKCDILLEKTGYYQIMVVDNTYVTWGAQDYGLAFDITPPLIGDFNLDYIVNDTDLGTLVAQWLATGEDLAPDLALPFGRVDFADFALLIQNWLSANNAYYEGY